MMIKFWRWVKAVIVWLLDGWKKWATVIVVLVIIGRIPSLPILMRQKSVLYSS